MHSRLSHASLPIVMMVAIVANTESTAAFGARGDEQVRRTVESVVAYGPIMATTIGRHLPGLTLTGQPSSAATLAARLNGTPTAVTRPTPPVPIPTLLIDLNFCPGLGNRIPTSAFADATAGFEKIAGYGLACNPNLPPGPDNPLRLVLGLRNPNLPYHPLFNSLAWQCGCR